MGVYIKIVKAAPFMTLGSPCKCADGTLCPIPIGRRSLITALFRERVFKVLDVISVPREEQSRVMNLFIGLKR